MNNDNQRGWMAWMARNPVAANLLMAVLLVGGVLVTMHIKQEVFPEYDMDIVSISVPYPGASPRDVEKGVLLAIEEEVRGLDGVEEVRSSASEGAGVVSVELLSGTDANKAQQDIKNAVDRITSFPAEVERLTVSLLTTRNKVIDLVIYGDQPESVLRELAEQARDRLTQSPDVTLAELAGVRPLEISIEVPQAELRRYGLTLGEIAARVRSTALELPGGGVKTDAGEVLLRTDERRDLGSEFAPVPLVSDENGTQVRLGDIAKITDGFADTDQATYFNGKPAAIVRVYRVGDQTPVQVARVVRDMARRLRANLPEGVTADVHDDWSEIYRDRVRLLLRNAVWGLLLVLILLTFFLELKLAFWVTLGIPVSFLGALFLMPGLDVSINMISLFAFIMALGMVVDDAIIVGENIYEMRQQGLPYLQAAVKGVRQIAVPVVFSVLTNMVAFAPMLFVPGFVGKIFWVIPAVIVPVFLVSLVESLFILPAHLGHQRGRRTRGVLAFIGRQQMRVSEALAWAIRTLYGALIHFALRWRYATVAVGSAVLALTLGFIVSGRIDVVVMPRIVSDQATASVLLPYGAPIEQTRAVQQRLVEAAGRVLDDYAESHDGKQIVRGVFTQIGVSQARAGPAGGTSESTGGHAAFVRVDLLPNEHDDLPMAAFVQRWRDLVGDLPGVESLRYEYEIGPGAGTAIDVELSHRDLPTLEKAAAELADRLKEFGGVRDIDAGFSQGKPQLNMTLTPEAESLGLTSRDLGAQVRHAFYGAEALRQQRGRDEIKVMVRLPERERRSEFNVDELVIRAPQGGEIMLPEAARIERTRAYTDIQRTDSRRVRNVTAGVDEEVTNAEKVVAELERGALPQLMVAHPGLTYSLGGERRSLNESLEALGRGLMVALIVIYAMLAVPLRSYLQPIIIMTAIPFGIVGAVLGHLIMGYELSLMSFMGMVALAGVVVNDSLVLICATNERLADGASAYEAVSSAGVRRFRPILLTSLTTFFGLAPMIFESSVQARFLIPMAVSLGYGVLMATFITLLLVPSLYMIVDDVRRVARFLRNLVTDREEGTRTPTAPG
jgi:multidrug efflux pump subunit AcrB